jgi:hypothetical protein
MRSLKHIALGMFAHKERYTTCVTLSQVKELHGCIEGKQTKIQSFFTSIKQQHQQQRLSTSSSAANTQFDSVAASSSSSSGSYSSSSSSAVRSGGVITAADWESDAPIGSYTHDSYAAVTTGTEPLRLLRIRNPWGMLAYYIHIIVCALCI